MSFPGLLNPDHGTFHSGTVTGGHVLSLPQHTQSREKRGPWLFTKLPASFPSRCLWKKAWGPSMGRFLKHPKCPWGHPKVHHHFELGSCRNQNFEGKVAITLLWLLCQASVTFKVFNIPSHTVQSPVSSWGQATETHTLPAPTNVSVCPKGK